MIRGLEVEDAQVGDDMAEVVAGYQLTYKAPGSNPYVDGPSDETMKHIRSQLRSEAA